MFKYTALLFISLLTFQSLSHADDDTMVVQLSRLSLDTANQVAMGAVMACREKGIQVSVAVVDRNGTVQALVRDTIAAPVSIKIAKMKAYTAANFNASTSALSDRANSPIGRVKGLVMSSGGVPIQVGGSLLGAVGVSGAPSGKTDEECAIAGIDAVKDDLEMSL
jgi:uncharacterized protein GlcG (DUF336 family)